MPKPKSKYKKDKDPYHPDDYTISVDGNYFVKMKLPWYRKVWLAIDAIIFAVVYLLIGFSLSVFLNDYTVRPLHRDSNPPKGRIAAEIIAQALLSVFFIYLVIQILPRIMPNIYPNPPREHYFFRQFICDILLPFSLMAAEYRLVDKIRYVFDTDPDYLDDLIDSYNRCPNGFACG